MKTIRSIKFTFTEEEIEHVRAILEMLQSMEDYDYNELCDQIEDKFNHDFHEVFGSLDNLLFFMESHVDLQDN